MKKPISLISRTAEEVTAYIDGYNDCFKQFTECLKAYGTINDTIDKMNVFVWAINAVGEKDKDEEEC